MNDPRQSLCDRLLLVAGGGLFLAAIAGLWVWDRHRGGGDLGDLARSSRLTDRLQAAGDLARRDSDAARKRIARMVEDADVAVAVQAVESLGVHPRPEDRAILERVLTERRRPPEVQAAAAATLGGYPDGDPTVLMDALRTHDQPIVRAGAAQGLTRLGDARSVPALSRALEDGDARVRIWAISAIHKMVLRRFPYDARRDPSEQREVIERIRDYLRSCGVQGIE
jgi:hypothetical protein